MADLVVTQGDNKPDVTATLRDKLTGAVLNLSNVTQVFFRMRKADDKRWTINAAGTITDAPNGRVRYSWGANDLANDGDFEAYWHLVYNDATKQSTVPVNTIEVRRR